MVIPLRYSTLIHHHDVGQAHQERQLAEFAFRVCSNRKQSRSAIWWSLYYGNEVETCASFLRSVRTTMTEVPMLTANTDGGDDRVVPLKADLCVFETRSCLHVSSKEVKERKKPVLLAGIKF
jgi:hypothetical protein